MKRYVIAGMAALAAGCTFTACTQENSYDEAAVADQVVETYEKVFVSAFGQPAADQDWGFGVSSYKDLVVETAETRSQSAPSLPDISAPYDAKWVTNYLKTAAEPNSKNVIDNYDNSTYARKAGTYAEPYTTYYADFEAKYPTANYGWDWNKAVAAAKAAGWAHFNDLFEYTPDPDYVTQFKITGTWSGDISVAASEGSSSPGAERTIVVTGTWNITVDQRIGSKGMIVIANGGKVNVASGKTLSMVNEARLVVLPGGTLTGAGKVEVNNGNAAGLENYNGGTIDVAIFNNNFGKFHNYGAFLVNEYQGGAQESNFYNHGLVSIDHMAGTGSTANARVFNNCQFYVAKNARIRNYEGVGGSALIVGGQLMFSSSEDGTKDITYVGLAAGALVKCGTLYNNGTSWTGPKSGGYAALEIDNKIEYLNWEQDHPTDGGYFENNIYVKSATWDNVTDGNGYHQTDASDTYNHSLSIADYKFWQIIANCRGNGGVKKVKAGSKELLPKDADFKKGSTGCTPGFYGEEEGSTTNPTADIRIIAEDLTINDVDNAGKAAHTDIDFNDVVFDVEWTKGGANITLQAAGGTLPLVVGVVPSDKNKDWEKYEVHKLFGVATNTMVNTNYRTGVNKKPVEFSISGNFSNDGSNIPIYVQKGGKWHELTAQKGKPASKIGVAPTFVWCNERQAIDDKYPNFKDWVVSKTPLIWW